MKFNTVRIVLVATSHPGNIGSTARAMKTMGFERLYLVSPKTFPHYQAHEMSAGADDLLDKAVITHSLKEALNGCQMVLATSARSREIDLPGLTPAEAGILFNDTPDSTEIAIVFGREHAGLTNEELLHCHYQIHIPSNPLYSSLNLSQAVQIVVYELRMRHLSPTAEVSMRRHLPASTEEVEGFHDHLRDVLIAIDFLKLSNPKKLLWRLRRMFNRIRLEQVEVNILRGILTHIQYGLKKVTTLEQNK